MALDRLEQLKLEKLKREKARRTPTTPTAPTEAFLPGQEVTEQKIATRTAEQPQRLAELRGEFKTQAEAFRKSPLKTTIETSPPAQAIKIITGLGRGLADLVDEASQMTPIERAKEAFKVGIFPGSFADKALGLVGRALNESEVGRTAIKSAAVALPRIEAAIANPLLEVQAGNIDSARLISSFGQGIGGRRVGELGDVFRKQLLNRTIGGHKIPDRVAEGISSTAGLASMVGFYKLMGQVATGARKNLLKNRKFLVDQSTKGIDSVKGTMQEFQGKYQELYGQIDDGLLTANDVVKTRGILNSLSPQIRKELLPGLETGKVTIKQLREIRQLLNEQTSQSAWFQAQRARNIRLTPKKLISAQQQLKNDILFRKNPQGVHVYMDNDLATQIRNLDPIYTELKRTGKGILDTLIDTNGNPRTDAMVQIFTNADKAGKRNLFRRFATYSNKMGEFNTSMDKFAFRRALGRRAAGVGIGIASVLAIRSITNALKEAGGGGTTQSGGGGG